MYVAAAECRGSLFFNPMQDASTPTNPAPRQDGIRDTIESIVVAFILAFVFRAFLVEAFVIPTGSMAPGLYGQHGQHRCDLCQYPFAYGISEGAVYNGREKKGTLAQSFSVLCPNCGYNGGANGHVNNEKDRVSGRAGDRILVLKWPYEIGGAWFGPKRWDVVVFKDTQDGETNFIKRLIGLPGEVLEIIDGDIYAAPIESVSEDIREVLLRPPQLGNRNAPRLTPDQRKRLASALRIQRKTRIAQDSLWMIHYDHDYEPDLSRAGNSPLFTPPKWQPHEQREGASPWDASKPRVRFTPKDKEIHSLWLSGKAILDTYGYNDVNEQLNRPVSMANTVGDIRLSFVLVPAGNQGHIDLSLRKNEDTFTARINVSGTVELSRRRQGGATPSQLEVVPIRLRDARIDPLVPNKPIEIEFENVDYRVALRINGVEVLATDDSQYSPPIMELIEDHRRGSNATLAGVEIGAAELPLELRHLRVHRDVFYRSADVVLDERPMSSYFTGRVSEDELNPYVGYPGWGTTGNPILLRDKGPRDYYCLGDNSPQSKDSRMWWEVCPYLKQRGDYQYGTVPEDQMIGRAFFVYWPSGLRFSKETPAIIPNVGRMRIIR